VIERLQFVTMVHNRRLSQSSARLRALCKWVDGPEKGTFTHNVDVDWILNVGAMFPTHGETYAIEWRVGSRPKTGWPVYDAVVLDTSCKFLSGGVSYFCVKMAYT